MKISFEGAEADQHRIEAFSGAESLSGIARAAVLVAHYAATGEVRYRAPYSDAIQFFIEAPVEGSLEFPLKILADLKEALAEHKKKLAVALLAVIIARATGQAPEAALKVDDQLIRSGDIDALSEAATPGLLRAHYWLDEAGKAITFQRDGSPAPTKLTPATKAYMETEELGERNTRDVSVAALNANSKIGRIYFGDLGRTVPFKVAKEARNRTVGTLSRFLTQYVNKTGATVNIDYQPVYYPDKRLKRVIIFDCYAIDGAG